MSAHHDASAPSRNDLVKMIQAQPVPRNLKMIALVLAVVGFGIFIAGAAMGQERAWLSFHVNWLYFTIPSSAAVVFAAVQRITTARWSRSVIRLIEGFVAWLPVAFLLLLVTLLFGKGHIFPWMHETITIPEKALWLEPTFFTIRGIAVFGIITALSIWYIYTSVRVDVGLLPEWGASWAKGIREGMRRGFRDERREMHSTHSLQGRLAVFLALAFGFGWTVLAWDLSMSMDYHFQSTMFGWQVFMGGWLVMLMVFSLLLRWWRDFLGAGDVITDAHFHDVGKLCFAFTAFWGYLTFSQFLVIWYGNWAEETHYLRLMLISPWTKLSVSVAFLVFGAPFFGLLGKAPKLYLPTMAFFAGSSMVGMWIHRYLEIYPPKYVQTVSSAPFGIWEIGTTLGFLGLWGYCYIAFMDAFPRMRVVWMTSPYRDEMQVPVDAETMEPLPAHE